MAAEILNTRVDAVVRYGRDEFLILLADTNAVGTQSVIDRIHRKLEEWNAGKHLADFQVTVSVGAAEWHEGDTLDEMLDGADRKMFEQKGS